MQEYHYVYKTTVEHEKYAGFYYYGKHSTTNLDDGYVGSGIKIANLNKKGYKLNREILCFFDSSEDAFEFEELLVDEDTLKDPYCMNLKTGGGWDYEYSEKSKAKMSKSASKRGVSHLQTPEIREKQKAKQSETRKKLWETDEYKAKMKDRYNGTGRSLGVFITPFGVYTSRTLAAEACGINPKTLYNRCRGNKQGFSFKFFEKGVE